MEDENEVVETESNDNVVEEVPNDRPAGYHPVDIENASPDEIKQRVDYLYGQVKKNERYINDYRQIAREQAQQIEDLMSGVGQVVDHMHTTATAQTEHQIQNEMKAALESGDTQAYVDAQIKLMDLKYGQKKQENQSKPQSKTSIYDIGLEAETEGEITPEELRIVEAWQGETDQMGRELRPWAINRSSDPNRPDPSYALGLRETMAVFTNPAYAKLSFDQKLSEIDRRMGTVKPQSGQSVLGGNLTTNKKTTKVNLTPKQQEIAVKTRFGGSKAKSDAEHIEAYRKQIEKSKLSKGRR